MKTQANQPIGRRAALRLAAGAASCVFCAAAAHAEGPVHWGYEGTTGPDKWGALSPENRTCSVGHEQTPIDLAGAQRADLGALQLTYPSLNTKVVHNGHTIQVNCDPGAVLQIGAARYELVQFHFHHPSEHLLAGRQLDLECHFVHRTASGALAVLGVFIRAGAANDMLGRIWSIMPSQEGASTMNLQIDPMKLLPAERAYFRYQGSLTTPPCSEGITWTVLKQPIEASADQIRAFAKLFPNNARPVMQRNQRSLLESA
jgi:carbonic anhydrase